jgi:hypothetical protein
MLNSIHPLFPKLKEKATSYLTNQGFKLFNEEVGKTTFFNESNIYVSIVNQRYDPPEVWIGKRYDKEMIRIDFILECYLTGKTELTGKHIQKKTLDNDENCFVYYSDFMEAYFHQIIKINPFPSYYYDWERENREKIGEVVEELRKKRTDNNV